MLAYHVVRESKTDKIKEAYNSGAKNYASYWKVPHDFIEEERSNFVEALDSNARILDLGCGPGFDSEYFYKKGFDVTGIDLSEEMIGIASQKISGAKFEVKDMKQLDYSDSSFDGLWSSFSFLHIAKEDAPAVLDKLNRILCPGGILVLALHSPEDSSYQARDITGLSDKDGKQLEAFVQEWKKEEIEELISKAGFSIKYSRAFKREGGWYPLLSIFAINEA